MIAFFLALLTCSSLAQPHDIIRLNQGILFKDLGNVHFVINEWIHTIKFDLPRRDINFSDVSLCKDSYFSEKGCPITVDLNVQIHHLNHEKDLIFQVIDNIIPMLHFQQHSKRDGPILGFVGD